MAMPAGIRRGSLTSPPAAATRPRLTSGMPNLASSAATIRSQASATSQPPASAHPSTAAISGLRGGALVRRLTPPVTSGVGRAFCVPAAIEGGSC
jgi:hypothetical protein